MFSFLQTQVRCLTSTSQEPRPPYMGVAASIYGGRDPLTVGWRPTGALEWRPRSSSSASLTMKVDTRRGPLSVQSTRWTTTVSSKVDLHDAIISKVLWAANLVTYPSNSRGNETRVAHPPSGSQTLISSRHLTRLGRFRQLIETRVSINLLQPACQQIV